MTQTTHITRKKKWLIGISSIVMVISLGLGTWFFALRSDSPLSTASEISADQSQSADSVTLADSDIDWSALPTTEVALTDDGLNITAGGTYIVSGTSTAAITVETDENVRIALNGVSITSNDGAAINVIGAKNTYIDVVAGSKNYLADADSRSDDAIDGTIYSADDLTLYGTGSLTVVANFADGIVGKDDLTLTDLELSVTSTDDGIRGKDSVEIAGATITVKAEGDGIKSTNDTDADRGYLQIDSGTVVVDAGDDALKGEQNVIINGGDITVNSSVEGIEGAQITINGGTVDIYASDDGINAASDTVSDLYVKITGGDVTVEVGQGDTDCIDSNGDIIVSGGTIRATNPGIGSGPATAFDYNGTAEFTGGTIYINGEQVDEIPAEQMGGGGGMTGRP